MRANSLSYQELPECLAAPWLEKVISLDEALELYDLWLEAGRPDSLQVPQWLEPAVQRMRLWQILDRWEPPEQLRPS